MEIARAESMSNPFRLQWRRSARGYCRSAVVPLPIIGNSATPAITSTAIASKPALAAERPTTLPLLRNDAALCCDKCDGKHETDKCPYYKKDRDDHPDARRRSAKQIGGTSSLPGSFLSVARVVHQPGDGSCLFHSISYGWNRTTSGSKHNAQSLRQLVGQFIAKNPTMLICDTPLQEWVKWDSNCAVSDYSRRIASGGWGGGIEMACLSHLLRCNIHVYERKGIGFRRISAFDCAESAESFPVVKVLYCGGVHYDALS